MDIAGSVIVPILINLFSSDLYSGKQNIIRKIQNHIKKSKIKTRLEKWCSSYLYEHDGTILSEGRFLDYIKYYKPIQDLYSFAVNPNPSESDDAYVLNLVKKTKDTISKGLDVSAEREVKQFYKSLLSEISEIIQSELTGETKVLLRAVKQSKNDRINQNDQTKTIIINNGAALLSETDSLELFKLLNSKFWDGNFDELNAYVSALEGKSADLVIWIKLTLSMFLNNPPYLINFSEYTNISCAEIRDDIVKKHFIISYFENDYKNFSAIPYSMGLKHLIDEVINDNLSYIYTQTKEKKNNKTYVGIKLNESIHDEKWVAKRILLIHMNSFTYAGVSNSMRSLLEGETDFFTDLLCFRRRVSEAHTYNDTTLLQEYETFISHKQLYKKLIPSMAATFYSADILYTLRFGNKELLSGILESIPPQICNHENVADNIYSARIELGLADYNEIDNRCNAIGKYWLYHQLLCSLSDDEVIKFLDSRQQALIDPLVFCDYVRALHHAGEFEKRDSYLAKYGCDFENISEYWFLRINLLQNIEDVNSYEQKWKAGELMNYSPMTDAVAAEVFYKWQKYQTCIEAVESCKEKEISDDEIIQYKISSLFRLGRKIDAFSELSKQFDNGVKNEYVLNNLMALSLELNRSLPQGLLENAKNFYNYKTLILSANLYEREGMKEEARELYRKALLASDGKDSYINMKYWDFLSRNHFDLDRSIDCVDVETAITLKNCNDSSMRCICVSESKFVTADSFVWNGILHISYDKAVHDDLLRKAKGDKVTFDDSVYIIDDIMTIEGFYQRCCLGELVRSGSVIALSGPISDDPEKKIKTLIDWLNANIGEDLNNNYIEEYLDFTKYPISFYMMSRKSPVTYAQFIKFLYENKTIVVREALNQGASDENNSSVGYVLSYPAMVLMHLLGISPDVLSQNNVYVPKSAYVVTQNENEESRNNNNRDNVSFLGKTNGKIYYSELEETDKLSRMRFSSDIQRYCQSIPCIDNFKSISNEFVSEENIISLCGVVDYDAISICKTEGFMLVSVEKFTTELAILSGIEVPCINIYNFVKKLGYNIPDRLSILRKMVDYRMINILDDSLLHEINNCEVDERILDPWKEYLCSIDESQGIYREYMKYELTSMLQNNQDMLTLQQSQYIREFISLVLKLNSLKIHLKVNQNGEFEIEVIPDTDDGNV